MCKSFIDWKTQKTTLEGQKTAKKNFVKMNTKGILITNKKIFSIEEKFNHQNDHV